MKRSKSKAFVTNKGLRHMQIFKKEVNKMMKNEMTIIYKAKELNDFRKKMRADDSIVSVHTLIYDTIVEMLDLLPEGNILLPFLDPYQTAPLSMVFGVKTTTPTKLSVTVHGKDSSDDDISHEFEGYATQHVIPVLGLYPNYNNTITIRRETENQVVAETVIQQQTESLPEDFGVVELVVEAQRVRLNDELYYVGGVNAYPAAIDYSGEVRWYFNQTLEGFDSYIEKGDTSYYKLLNGRLLYRSTDTYSILESDQSGRIYKITTFDFKVHHDVVEKEEGILLVQSTEVDSQYIEDTLTLYNYNTGEILKEIDFKEILDVDRPIQPETPPFGDPGKTDWLHSNSVEFDDATNVYITSSRKQNCVFAIDQDSNELRWILGSHFGWREEFEQYLLTPVDAEGNTLYNLSDPEGELAADHNFWNWAQHCAKIYTESPESGVIDLFLFNNGNSRSYHEENWIRTYENWSGCVKFRINTNEMTVQLLWEFGSELGSEYYSSYVSNSRYIPETNSVYISFTATNIDSSTGHNVGISGDFPSVDDYFADTIQEYTRTVEVDMDTKEILFAFNWYAPHASGIATVALFRLIKTGLYSSY